MKLFSKKKNQDLSENETSTAVNKASDGRIKVLGTGCAKCDQLERLTKEVLVDLGKDEPVIHLSDLAEIIQYGVMSTPALVVDEKVLFAGRVPPRDELKKMLQEIL